MMKPLSAELAARAWEFAQGLDLAEYGRLQDEVRKRPDDAYAAYYLAYAFVGAQDPQPAVTLLAKIIEVHPDFTDAHTLLGLARIRTSDFAGAATEYEAVLGREPKNAAALLGMGMIAYWKRETAMAGWVLCVVGVTLALTFMASAGLPGAWSGMRHYQDGKARLASLDYAGCAAEMEQGVEAVPTSPKVWAYEAFCYLLDKDTKAGLSAWYTARSYDPAITLDTKSEQQILLIRVRLASLPPKGAQ